ncbi:hypothetical protein G3567_00715 [Psychroflexus sp. YR1-1]|uniref:Uncharacterized protein n=1 Tax=Psychroflexus aurantiacus TaxID=2709310 RepID=A0A6B3QX33_9FLAO|nr:hypothetical protein [Psychroflexus aurantiacus]NEV92666.1 hypothetical protein [Psychroflexus aurantiacus]
MPQPYKVLMPEDNIKDVPAMTGAFKEAVFSFQKNQVTNVERFKDMARQHSYEMCSATSKVLGIIETLNTDTCSQGEEKVKRYLIKKAKQINTSPKIK